MGGMVVLDWASRHPSDFDRFVVLNTSAGGLSRPWERVLPAGAVALVRSGLKLSFAAREAAAVRVVCNHEKRFAAVTAHNQARGKIPRALSPCYQGAEKSKLNCESSALFSVFQLQLH